MKHWLVAMALICLGSAANAATDVTELYQEGCVTSRVYVTSFTATSPSQMDSGALDTSTTTAHTQNGNNLRDARKIIMVQNLDRNGMAYKCDQSSTTLPASELNFGNMVASSETYKLQIPARDSQGNRLKLWCRSMGALVSTASVTQCN